MQRVNREKLLNQLEAVSPGLSIKAEFEQSHCYVIKDGKLRTFNDEISCWQDSCLQNGAAGAVHAKPLMDLLRKMPDEEIGVDIVKGKFRVKGKGINAGIACYEEIVLAYDEVDEAQEWHPFDSDVLEALAMVAECASDDQAAYMYTCVRITPDCIEGMNRWEAGRYKIASPVEEPIYIRKVAVKHIVDLGMEEMSIGERWAHFRSSDGLYLSCRVSKDEEFPNLTPILVTKGKRTKFPKGLSDAIERAQIMCEDEDKYVSVDLDGRRLKVGSRNDDGWFEETKSIKYKGPPLSFQMSAPLLSRVCQKYNILRIGNEKMGVKVGDFQYVTALRVE